MIGLYLYLRWLADKFPSSPIDAVDCTFRIGPSMEQLLEETKTAFQDAASKIHNLEKDNAGLGIKVEILEKEIDFISHERYALIYEKWTLENKLGDFNLWRETQSEYEKLNMELIMIKSQRAEEHILQERTLKIAKEAKIQLAAAKQAGAKSKIAHSHELEQVRRERDESKEQHQTLLAAATAANTTSAVTAATASTTTVAKGSIAGVIALQEDNNRLTLALRSQTSDLDRMQSFLKTRSNQSDLHLELAASIISSLLEDKVTAEERIAGLERDVQEANERAEELKEMYMAMTFVDEGEGKKRENEEEEGGKSSEVEKAETSRLLKQIVAMSKKGLKETGTTLGRYEADRSESEDEEKEGDDDDENYKEENEWNGAEDEKEGEGKKIHDENEDLFKDMIGCP